MEATEIGKFALGTGQFCDRGNYRSVMHLALILAQKFVDEKITFTSKRIESLRLLWSELCAARSAKNCYTGSDILEPRFYFLLCNQSRILVAFVLLEMSTESIPYILVKK